MLDRLARQVARGLAWLSALAAGPALALTLLGTTGQGKDISTLIEVDPVSGDLVRTIGSIGHTINGLTYDASTGTLYGTTAHHDGTLRDALVRIDPATGAATPVGSGAGLWVALATANSKGEIYAWSGGPVNASRLVKFDKAAGTATEVGYPGIAAARHSLAFDRNDVLYLLTPVLYADVDPVLFTLDPVTAAPTAVGPVPGLPIYFAHHGTFNPADNLLYALDASEDYSPTTNFVVIDPVTHAVLRSVPTVAEMHTMAFVPPLAAPPPAVVAAASRKVHGAAGSFDLALSLPPAAPQTEPRAAGAGRTHTLVVTFDKDVVAGSAGIGEGTAAVGTLAFNGRDMTVPLTGVADAQYVTVVIWGVVGSDGSVGGAGSVRIGFLEGDVNASRVVTLSDLLEVNSVLAQDVTAATFLHDVDANGVLSLGDVLAVNAHLAASLPPP